MASRRRRARAPSPPRSSRPGRSCAREKCSSLVSRFGAIDPTDKGHAERQSLVLDLQRAGGSNASTRATAYVMRNELTLFSNFTYFLDDPVNGELGLRTVRVRGLQSTLSLWYLGLDSELLFLGDAGTTEAGRPSRRLGVEWTNYARLRPWLTADADVSFSRARFRDDDPMGRFVPGALDRVIRPTS